MKIRRVSTDTARIYDHGPLAAACLAAPGDYFTDEEEDFPMLSVGQVRGGAMRHYRPAGAFDVRRRAGVQTVAFLGVPTTPWKRGGTSEGFHRIERTLDPSKCPDGTPEHVVEALRQHRKLVKKAAKREAKERAEALDWVKLHNPRRT